MRAQRASSSQSENMLLDAQVARYLSCFRLIALRLVDMEHRENTLSVSMTTYNIQLANLVHGRDSS